MDVPQWMRVTFPALGNQVVFFILGSSLVEVIGGLELTGESYAIGSLTYRYFEAFAIAAILYLVAVQLLLLTWTFVGRPLAGGCSHHARGWRWVEGVECDRGFWVTPWWSAGDPRTHLFIAGYRECPLNSSLD